MSKTSIGSSTKYVYITSDGVVFRKKVKDAESSVSSKLEKLRSQVVKYAEYYNESFTNGIIEPEKVKEKKKEWIESTIRYYEINFGDALDSIITYFDFKIDRIEQEKLLVKTK